MTLAHWAWAYLFKAKNKKEFEMLQKTNVVGLKKAIGRMARYSATDEARHLAEIARQEEMNHKMYMDDAKAKGIAEGEARGVAKTAQAMLKKGFPIEDIMSITNLSRFDIEKLATN
jgi:predicted transposase/invertase (TIGR01784 family)